MRRLFTSIPAADPEGLPPAEFSLAPDSVEAAAEVLRTATDHRMRVLIWGAGNHQGYGHRLYPDIVLVTTSLNRVESWEPGDLTVVAESGVSIARVEEMLAEHRQTTLLPHADNASTIGGALAVGQSSYHRLRYGPTRDRVLEATVVTGDGRTVRGGGRVVKNVTGYDLPRLMVGALGRLGLIGSVCLKLVPIPAAALTVTITDSAAALASLYRPLALLSTPRGHRAYLWGTLAEVESQAELVGGEARPGHDWPKPPAGRFGWSLRVPPSCLRDALGRLPDSWDYVAQHGVGIAECASEQLELDAVNELRRWAESIGGALVVTGGPDDLYEELDPWGSPPAALAYQRRLSAQFDPYGILNPGRLPGGI